MFYSGLTGFDTALARQPEKLPHLSLDFFNPSYSRVYIPLVTMAESIKGVVTRAHERARSVVQNGALTLLNLTKHYVLSDDSIASLDESNNSPCDNDTPAQAEDNTKTPTRLSNTTITYTPTAPELSNTQNIR